MTEQFLSYETTKLKSYLKCLDFVLPYSSELQNKMKASSSSAAETELVRQYYELTCLHQEHSLNSGC